ncbi:Homeodomain-like domain-containing protein [Brevinema andersonii]|uniref:Homeodomain-like domain-containing protein n=1 Tax=Brevinema andersonii TaxID=34097 RepID=A0A1I1ES32_BREAD|nr:helix-turn-helix domain-containing protein [Brevinema andersonii]SFB88318.1 Homeodomain-like domain-containing protein [Brevinema andersonii]
MMKQVEKLGQAISLYSEGMTQKEIAQVLDVHPQTISIWKNQYKGTPLDWDIKRLQVQERRKAFPAWIEEKIDEAMKDIDRAIREGIPEEDYIKRLDAFISMKKKYDIAIDKLGEAKRVMEHFILFVKEHHQDVKDIIKETIARYLRQVGQ